MLLDSEELFPTRLPKFNTKNIQRMLRKQINTPTTKRQLRTRLGLWYRRNLRPLRRNDIDAYKGIGFIKRKFLRKEICRAITCGKIKADDDDDEIYEANAYDDKPVEAEPAPEELEDGGQAATMDELKEVNLGTEEDSRPTFISSLLQKIK
ncbi:hypothetical protein MA16_Dca027976 [Dendrobium catenatum]|uniref:Uncharacterized protein n=1 Tax=Dendrobium catenatum TaxID=906689 RepID=A0A2I0VG93_9ASPA|nr:hypothetical protein MA16_Dca027976 [Dendrobium catenatum]